MEEKKKKVFVLASIKTAFEPKKKKYASEWDMRRKKQQQQQSELIVIFIFIKIQSSVQFIAYNKIIC